MAKLKDEFKAETNPLIVETAEIITVSKEPEPVQEPDTTTIDKEPDYPTTPTIEVVKSDEETAELINSVIRRSPIKRAEAFVSETGEKRVFVYAEGGMILRFIGRFDVSKN